MGTDDKFINANDDDIKKHDARLKHILNDSQKQRAKFIEMARALECDESEESFNEKLKAIATIKPVA